MKGSVNRLGLTRTADSYVVRLEQAQKLKEIANRKNYSYKINLLHRKLVEEHSFWNQKETPLKKVKLQDLDKDLIFIESQKNTSEYNKERIDMLMSKYGCK